MDNKTTQTPDHEYVDLGLPSGTLWATENIKDTDGNELYFVWGETIGHTAEQVQHGVNAFRWDNYKFGPKNTLTKYNQANGPTVLEPEDDAATQNWGAEWKMPTNEQFMELMEGTNYKWTEINGIKGLLFTSKTNGNTVFFAAAGLAGYDRVGDVGYGGNYWTASSGYINNYFARGFSFWRVSHGVNHSVRCGGFSIRPVRVLN